jgi:hypothetical protein
MKSLVEQVVNVLDQEELSEFGKSLSQMGWGKSTYNKKTKTVSRPFDPTFYRHDKHWLKDKKNVKFLRKRLIDQEKERRRKLVKKSHPNKSLEWIGSRWVVKEELYCLWLHRQEQLDEIEGSIDSRELNEISLRTVGIGGSVLKLNGWRRKVESGISKLRSLSTSLNTSKTPEQTNKILSDIYKVDGDVLLGLSKMILWSSGISVSGLLGLEKTLTKKLKTSKRR